MNSAEGGPAAGASGCFLHLRVSAFIERSGRSLNQPQINADQAKARFLFVRFNHDLKMVAKKVVVLGWCQFIATAFMPWLIELNEALTLVKFPAPSHRPGKGNPPRRDHKV